MYKLLIAEDEELERLALKKIIERNFPNIQVLSYAKNGQEAINLAKIYNPDILLMDIRMPVKNGLEAQKQIIKFLPEVKTIIITAYSEFEYAQEAIKSNVYDFLLKPVSPKLLSDCIKKMLDSVDFRTNTTNPLETPFSQEILCQSRKIIEENYLTGLTLKDVSKQLHLSEKYFSRYFKTKTGCTFTQYVQTLKINRAKDLLKHTTDPVYRIAMDLNFSDSSYFTKVFVKHEGITPREYRQRL